MGLPKGEDHPKSEPKLMNCFLYIEDLKINSSQSFTKHFFDA